MTRQVGTIGIEQHRRDRRRGRCCTALVTATMVTATFAVAIGATVSTPAPASASTASVNCPPPQPTGSFYAALGDSYSSGEGLGCYLAGTNVSGPGGDQCHRSTYAYPELITKGDLINFAACSGAKVTDMYTPQRGEGTTSQVDQVTSNTGVVTLTIGGDSVGWTDILHACASGVVGDSVASRPYPYFFGPQGGYSCSQWESREPSVINNTLGGTGPDSLRGVYEAILAKLPRLGKLVVGTYPNLFPTAYKGANHFGGQFCVAWGTPVGQLGFIHSDVAAFVKLEGQLNALIRSTVQSIYDSGDTRIRVADIASSYPNNTISCGDTGRPTPFVNAIVLALGEGVPTLFNCVSHRATCKPQAVLSQATFHPRIQGQNGYATVFSPGLSLIAYETTVEGDHPISFWPLDDAAGSATASDLVGSNTGSLQGGVSSGVAGGPMGENVTSFDGGSCSGINLDPGATSLAPVNQLTVEAWIRSTTASDGVVFRRRFSGYALSADWFSLWPSQINTVVTDPSNPTQDAGWHYLVATYDGSAGRLYVDGSLVAAASGSGPIYYAGSEAAIGRDGDACDGVVPSFTGDIGLVAVYGQALSASQITSHYQASGL